VIAAAAAAHIRVQPTLQVVIGERAFFDPSLLDDPRLPIALPPAVIQYLRSPAGVKAREALLEQYRQASPPAGFERSLAAAIGRTRSTLALMLKNHVSLIFGSDTPAGEGFGNPPGLNGRLELQDWADAGVPLALILRAATLDNAVALNLGPSLGSIEVGKRADLLLLGENPLDRITAYDAIGTIFLGGEPLARDALRPSK
jgi:imidazolonepropionase-like amidohydrolase